MVNDGIGRKRDGGFGLGGEGVKKEDSQ